ncbi:hypothetical protein P7K49_023869 [Saguinus oedipus]|uniref:Uncharacterized protein n=1 Tax=Saguinus oedipus TaxID=9490 RepID=A0ABQ9UMZ2_SAGOE|nr:hypothetical protein P7K49_023869 [Saguinus oedipus]
MADRSDSGKKVATSRNARTPEINNHPQKSSAGIRMDHGNIQPLTEAMNHVQSTHSPAVNPERKENILQQKMKARGATREASPRQAVAVTQGDDLRGEAWV